MINFESLFNISYGLYIVSSGNKEISNGFIANALFQVTAEPPQFAVCCNKDNYSSHIIKSTGAFSVSVLHQEASMELIGTFGYKSGKDIDKFKGVAVDYGISGVPIVKQDCNAIMECKLVQTIEVGTHYIFIGELIFADTIACGIESITYSYYRNVKKGFAPKNAPTFIDKSKISGSTKEEAVTNTYKCNVCGYLYKESEDNSFENLADDWRCPICGVGKEDFSLI